MKCGDAMWNGVVHGGMLRCECGSGIPSDVAEWFDARHGGVMKCSVGCVVRGNVCCGIAVEMQCGMCGTCYGMCAVG